MGIDTVHSFTPGDGQNVGQSEEYFPENIYGLPDTNARHDRQSAMPENICSIGFGGEIIVGFQDLFVIDGPGADFTVFENAFMQAFNNKIFAEPGIVSVSLNGIDYFEFPYDSLTLEGCAGLTPTHGLNDPFDPSQSGGDQFDLADLGLEKIKYIKIKDYTVNIKDNPNHPFYDPTLSGFDLDAVIGLNLSDKILDIDEKSPFSTRSVAYFNDQIIVNLESEKDAVLKVYDLNGKMVIERNIFGSQTIINQKLFAGFFLVVVISKDNVFTKKLLVY